MTIQRKFQLLFVALFCTMLLAAVTAIWAIKTADQLFTVETRRLNSLQLADELRQSSDDLTRMARSFAATRDPKFEGFFQNILNIRAGNIPYPKGYDRIFWDFVVLQKRPLSGEGRPMSFRNRMTRLEFSDKEFAKLAEAEQNSNELVKLENTAMNAVKGRFDDGSRTFSVARAPDAGLALRLLFGDEYHAAKARIMAPIADFIRLIETRTDQETAAIRATHGNLLIVSAAVVAAAIVLMIYAFTLLNLKLVSPLTALGLAVNRFRETHEALDLSKYSGNDEIGVIASGLQAASGDIAERDRMEAEIAEQAAILEATLEHMDQGISMVDADLKFISFNSKFLELFELPSTFSVGNTMEDYIRHNVEIGLYGDVDIEATVAELSHPDRHFKKRQLERTRPDGTIIEIRILPVASGGQVSLYTDVTEMKRAEWALRENEALFKTVLDNVPAVVFLKSPDGRFRLINRQYEDTYGVSLESVRGKTLYDIYPKELADKFTKSDREALEGNGTTETEHRIRKAEEDIDLNSIMFPVLDEEGEMTAFGGIEIDITRRKETEQNLARQKEVVEATLENVEQGIVMVDRDGDTITHNRRFEELFGQTVRDYPNFEEYTEVYLSSLGAEAESIDKSLQLLRDNVAGRWDRPLPDGRTVQITHTPLADGGYVRTYQDVTDRKEAEQALRHERDRAEQALTDLKEAQENLIHAEKMASLGQLTAGIAHEIKNPLNFINNFAETSTELLDELKEIVDPSLESLDEDERDDAEDLLSTLKSDLATIASHGRRADGIVRNMLLHSRGDAGDHEPTDINALIEESLNLAYHGERARDKDFNISIQHDFDPAADSVDLLPQEITRVLVNLFGNGFYAMRKRQVAEGKALYEPTIGVTTRDLGETVEIRVRDNGTGMPKDIRERLFTPFFTTKPAGEGTGLGLSLSFDIVTQQHKGSIEVASEEGEFTEFTLRLPRQFGGKGAAETGNTP